MNKTIFYTLLAAFLASGALATVMGYRVIAGMHDQRTGIASIRDPEYQRMPADAKTDWMTGFTLIERSGKEVRWQEQTGKVRVVNFFFSSCPGTCLQQNRNVQNIQQAYEGKEVVFLSISCDPDNDSPERLREYAEKLHADRRQWLFLTGRGSYIERMAREMFEVSLDVTPDGRTHTERLIVADKWGNVRGTFKWNDLGEMTQLRVLVDKLLAETAPPADVGQASGLPENEPAKN
jgi:cytochrome oxidase Cu insertion factor (SCO1/SenC/PrrC family)